MTTDPLLAAFAAELERAWRAVRGLDALVDGERTEPEREPDAWIIREGGAVRFLGTTPPDTGRDYTRAVPLYRAPAVQPSGERLKAAIELLRVAESELNLAAEHAEEHGEHYVAENKRKVADRIYRFLRPLPAPPEHASGRAYASAPTQPEGGDSPDRARLDVPVATAPSREDAGVGREADHCLGCPMHSGQCKTGPTVVGRIARWMAERFESPNPAQRERIAARGPVSDYDMELWRGTVISMLRSCCPKPAPDDLRERVAKLIDECCMAYATDPDGRAVGTVDRTADRILALPEIRRALIRGE